MSKNTGNKSGSKVMKTKIKLTASEKKKENHKRSTWSEKKKQQLPESSQTQVNRKLVASSRA